MIDPATPAANRVEIHPEDEGEDVNFYALVEHIGEKIHVTLRTGDNSSTTWELSPNTALRVAGAIERVAVSVPTQPESRPPEPAV